MTAARRHRALLVAALVTVMAAGGLLTGCGKKSGLRPPPGEAASYTYPRDYPAPLPGTQPRGLPTPEEEQRPSKLSPFPDSDTFTTRSY